MKLNEEMQFQAGGRAGGLSSVSIGVTIIPACFQAQGSQTTLCYAMLNFNLAI